MFATISNLTAYFVAREAIAVELTGSLEIEAVLLMLHLLTRLFLGVFDEFEAFLESLYSLVALILCFMKILASLFTAVYIIGMIVLVFIWAMC